MPKAPTQTVFLHRRQLEHALLRGCRSAQELLDMSRRLDALIAHAMRVRTLPIRAGTLRAVRRRVSRALP